MKRKAGNWLVMVLGLALLIAGVAVLRLNGDLAGALRVLPYLCVGVGCGLFGYGSTIVSGCGMGMLVQYTDWSVALYTLVGMALVGTAVFAAAWKAKPNGYDD